jgi:hypothetical protein
MKGLLVGVTAVGVAAAFFLALTLSVGLWLATASSREPRGHPYPVPSYGYVTPDPSMTSPPPTFFWWASPTRQGGCRSDPWQSRGQSS